MKRSIARKLQELRLRSKRTFFCVKKQLNGAKTKLLSQGRFFCKSDLSVKSAAQGGPDGGQHENFDYNGWWIPKARFRRKKKFDFFSNFWVIPNLPSRPPLYFPLNSVSFSSPCLYFPISFLILIIVQRRFRIEFDYYRGIEIIFLLRGRW